MLEVGADPGEFGLRIRERAFGLLQCARSGSELVLERSDIVGQLPFLGFEREQRRGFLAKLELEPADRLTFPADLGGLAGGFRLHLLDVHFEPAHGHGEFGAQLILVGLNFRPRQRGQRFQPTHGETHRARVHQWDDADDEQPRDQKPDPDVHDRFDHHPSSIISAVL